MSEKKTNTFEKTTVAKVPQLYKFEGKQMGRKKKKKYLDC